MLLKRWVRGRAGKRGRGAGCEDEEQVGSGGAGVETSGHLDAALDALRQLPGLAEVSEWAWPRGAGMITVWRRSAVVTTMLHPVEQQRPRRC